MNRIVSIVLLTALMSACSSSPFYHKVFMRGQIVGVDGDQVVFCIGSDSGASIGEEFVAHRYTYEDYLEDGEYYDTIEVGSVVVREIVNVHFAKGVISSGEVTKYDILFSQ
ncbi:hypothetical protein [Congregibacter litoralis]|uniref:DUF3221 domain-containing protein n=1 Tax=Congregibacter litoralis KT71 TaxID=314285 RepID=A4ADY8_9GAMM|nr:hypothetical protein [Congregibacter litoralis]EAQ95798.1 hypothetical protein KT71_13654 [Congregibacter litoralis KT71]